MRPRVIYRHRPAFRAPTLGETYSLPVRRSDWPRFWWTVGIPVALFLVAAIVFWPTLRAGFVSDDFFYHLYFKFGLGDYVKQIALVHNGDLGFPYTFLRPATLLSFKLDYLLWGTDSPGFHLTNIFLHSLNAVLFYFLLQSIGLRRGVAFVSALAFALFPSTPEAVTWVSGRFDVLGLTWLLGAMLLWCRGRLRDDHRMFLLASIAFFIAMLSKEVTAAGLLIFPILDWLLHIETRRERGQGIGFMWKWYIILFAITICLFSFRIWLFHGLGGYSGQNIENSYLSFVPSSIWSNLVTKDLIMLLTPVNRILWSEWNWWYQIIVQSAGELAGMLLIFGIIRAAIMLRWIEEAPFARIVLAIVWIIAFLAPTLPVAGVTSSLDYSRFLYIPAAGLAIWFGSAVEMGLTWTWTSRRLAIVIAAIALLVAGSILQRHNQVWLEAGNIVARINATMRADTENLPDNSSIFMVNFPLLWKGAHCAPLEYGNYLEFLQGTHSVQTVIMKLEPESIIPWWEDILQRWGHPGAGFVWDPSSRSVLVLPEIPPVEDR
jgi:hypothetical protein